MQATNSAEMRQGFFERRPKPPYRTTPARNSDSG